MPNEDKPSKTKDAWQKKYGKEQGSLLLKYRAKIGAQAKAKSEKKAKRNDGC